jgi:hypothetical protein
MDIGTGIAIAGVWLFAGMCWASTNVSAMGMKISYGTAIIGTFLFTLGEPICKKLIYWTTAMFGS